MSDLFFSEYFKIDPHTLFEYGALDISLICDLPFFIDPMLIFNSNKPQYRNLHAEIIRYFHFLAKKAQQGLQKNEIRAWFKFSEVKNNWLGYSLVGNGGLALGNDYANFLYKNIGFAIETNQISQSAHIEKVMLLYEGSGKDKISDLTVNLIKRFLLEYTQSFALQYIQEDMKKKFYVEKAYFNYETESFVSDEYVLPYITNMHGNDEYILLTPLDILREGEPSINRENYLKSQQRIRESIDNDVLRAYVNNYIATAVREYEEKQKQNKQKINERSISRIERKAFKELSIDHPELYDYYIRLREEDIDEIIDSSAKEVDYQLAKFHENARSLIKLMFQNGYKRDESLSAREEAIKRLKFFKHIIEDCDGYKNFYYQGQRISSEDDIRRMFRLVWYDTSYKVDFDTNNGRGEIDVGISKGQNNQNIIEFKLASNSSLSHVFTQVKIYEAANCAEGSLIAIFFFSEEELKYANSVVKQAGYEDQIGEAIFLIDCRADNKPSASKA